MRTHKTCRAALFTSAIVVSLTTLVTPGGAQTGKTAIGIDTPIVATAAELVAGKVILLQEKSPDYLGVWVENDRVKVLGKDLKAHSDNIDGVVVSYVPSTYSLTELRSSVEAFGKANAGLVHSASVSSDTGEITAYVWPGKLTDSTIVDRSELVAGTTLSLKEQEPEQLAAAEGGQTVTGSGCTSGFRYNGWLMSTASHCSNSWGTINGAAMNHYQEDCQRDNQVAWTYGGTSTTIQGMPFSGSQWSPAFGSGIYKYGVTTGWTYGSVTGWRWSTISCSVWVYDSTHWTEGGDSGGPLISLVWNGAGYSYNAHGTTRTKTASGGAFVPMGEINASRWSVG